MPKSKSDGPERTKCSQERNFYRRDAQYHIVFFLSTQNKKNARRRKVLDSGTAGQFCFFILYCLTIRTYKIY